MSGQDSNGVYWSISDCPTRRWNMLDLVQLRPELNFPICPHECSHGKPSGWWHGFWWREVCGAQGMHQEQWGKAEALPHSVYSCLEHASGVRHDRCFLPRSILWFTFCTGPQQLLRVKNVIKPRVQPSLQTDPKMPGRSCSGTCSTSSAISTVFFLLKKRVRQGPKTDIKHGTRLTTCKLCEL